MFFPGFVELVDTRISLDQHLELLRMTDKKRKWHSLDDKRVCLVCERIFTGRQIEIMRDRRGRYVFQCPTPGCPSDFSHWLLFGISPAQFEDIEAARPAA
jgi:hypothetical protein